MLVPHGGKNAKLGHGRLVGLLALLAQAAGEALRHHSRQRGGHEEGLHAHLDQALDWIAKEGNDPASRFYQKVETNRVAAMGMSCGGLMSYGASADPRIATVGIWNSGLIQPDEKIFAGLHSPVIIVTGDPVGSGRLYPSPVDLEHHRHQHGDLRRQAAVRHAASTGEVTVV